MNNNKKIPEEIGLGCLGVLGTHIESKVGLGIFLLIVGFGILFSPTSEDLSALNKNLTGFLFLLAAIILFFWRINQVNNRDE